MRTAKTHRKQPANQQLTRLFQVGTNKVDQILCQLHPDCRRSRLSHIFSDLGVV
jgi:hypothetical protein